LLVGQDLSTYAKYWFSLMAYICSFFVLMTLLFSCLISVNFIVLVESVVYNFDGCSCIWFLHYNVFVQRIDSQMIEDPFFIMLLEEGEQSNNLIPPHAMMRSTIRNLHAVGQFFHFQCIQLMLPRIPKNPWFFLTTSNLAMSSLFGNLKYSSEKIETTVLTNLFTPLWCFLQFVSIHL